MTVKTGDTSLDPSTLEKPVVLDDGRVFVPVYGTNTNERRCGPCTCLGHQLEILSHRSERLGERLQRNRHPDVQ